MTKGLKEKLELAAAATEEKKVHGANPHKGQNVVDLSWLAKLKAQEIAGEKTAA